MRVNVRAAAPYVSTHEGAPAYRHLKPLDQLRRSVLSCLLWEREFYENGQSIAERITETAAKVKPAELAALAIEARSKFNLRHVPLLLLTVLAKTGAGSSLVSDTIAETIQRADELSEFLAIYAKANGVTPDKVRPKMSAQVKKGLARAFSKFDAYHLAKYNRDGAIKLRDVMFLTHPKSEGDKAETLKKLAAKTLESPDTWEVALSAGADKKATFERLIREGELGYLALLRNLRNMAEAGCDMGLVRDAILARNGARRVLPFRYVAAARACPQLEPAIDQALSEAISALPVLSGKTVILVDVSGSMDEKLSGTSDLSRMDAAAALASVIHGDLRVFTFSNSVVEVPPRRGMAGIDAVIKSQPHQGTYLGQAVAAIDDRFPHDRMIVVTDEQSHDAVGAPKGRGYMINVASAKNGVGYGPWVHIDGFSEQVIRFIHEHEAASAR
jgi:60 kDa SS-A/Ro ribonucleoprotein